MKAMPRPALRRSTALMACHAAKISVERARGCRAPGASARPGCIAEIDRTILAGFVLGLSTRKVGEVLLALLGRAVSASTVVASPRPCDAAVAAFHARPLANRQLERHAGALRRPWWRRRDFRLAASESVAAWERFLTDLYRRVSPAQR